MTLKIAGVILCEILIYSLLKQYKPEFAVLSQIAACTVIFFMLGDEIRNALKVFNDLFEKSGISGEYIGVLLKILGITLVTQFSSDMCRDNGEAALAQKVEFAGKVIITAAGIPIIKGLTGFVAEMLEKI